MALWQLQADLGNYLEDEGFWGRYATHLSHDDAQRAIEVGILPNTSTAVVDQIRGAFREQPVIFVPRGSARAL
ncbi:hypothetical protein [Amnibacterium endophyticum]|uniref:Uncharacterized protein n=1 Tax=Amnibacterium endophyticum TaxID=2109337 RepID=A0ABW4LIC8_9MICO